jgi:flagellar hook-basal body complex protein FliE
MNSVRQITGAVLPAEPSNIKKSGGSDFTEIMKGLTREVDGKLKTADQKMQQFALGQSQNLHEVVVASEKADISLRFLLQLRNKLLEAYQEMMRMPM